MTPIGWLLVVLTAGMTVGANLLIRAGIDAAGGFPATLPEVPMGLWRLAMSPLFDVGFTLYVAATLIWFRVVATQPLSTAYPTLVSITFICVSLGAAFVFHEALTVRKVLGLGVILGGILIASTGP